MLAAFLATILFSLSAISGRRLSHYVSGTKANLARLLVASLALGAFAHLVGFGVRGVAFPILFLSGCVGFGIGDLSMFQAYPRIGARRTIVAHPCLAAALQVAAHRMALAASPCPRQPRVFGG